MSISHSMCRTQRRKERAGVKGMMTGHDLNVSGPETLTVENSFALSDPLVVFCRTLPADVKRVAHVKGRESCLRGIMSI